MFHGTSFRRAGSAQNRLCLCLYPLLERLYVSISCSPPRRDLHNMHNPLQTVLYSRCARIEVFSSISSAPACLLSEQATTARVNEGDGGWCPRSFLAVGNHNNNQRSCCYTFSRLLSPKPPSCRDKLFPPHTVARLRPVSLERVREPREHHRAQYSLIKELNYMSGLFHN